jgi:hypothetical protein
VEDSDKGQAIPLWDEFFPPRWDASQAGMRKVLIYLSEISSVPSRDGMLECRGLTNLPKETLLG